jgi:plastocyanin
MTNVVDEFGRWESRIAPVSVLEIAASGRGQRKEVVLRRTRWFGLGTLLVGAALVAVSTACGGGSGYGGSATAPPSPAGAQNAPTAEATHAGTTFTVVAQNSMYDNTKLDATAGELTIVFENRDAGVMHNLHLHVQDDDSKVIGETPITTGPDTQQFTLTIAPGSYHFHCEVHPATMFGTLTVE